MEQDHSANFRQRLPGQVEVCARKSLELLQKDLQTDQFLTPQDIYYLASAAQILLTLRDQYGKK
ncbi:hypothetical protein [Caudoviricetes sp.]|jgi:hypothetical protein|nr:hypothetical protein [Caudoviricetes sp.]